MMLMMNEVGLVDMGGYLRVVLFGLVGWMFIVGLD